VTRRRTPSRKPGVTRQRKTARPKRNSAPNAAHRVTSSAAHLQELLERQAPPFFAAAGLNALSTKIIAAMNANLESPLMVTSCF
jgi:hypothetical protein